MKFIASAVQFHPILDDVQANLQKMESLFLKVVNENKDVKLIVMPELATTGYECGPNFYNLAEIPESSKSISHMARLCAEYKVHLVFGLAEQDSNMRDILYNSAVLIDDNGLLAGCYRKVHLFAGEKNYFRAGCCFPLFETKLGRFGIFVCWDAAFPEPARVYAIKGADFLVLCSNYEKPYSADWDLITSARAFDNTLHIIASNRYGKDIDFDFFGRSRILDPLGKPISKLDKEKEGYITGLIDINHTLKLRQKYYTFFKDRMPNAYKELISAY